MTASTPDVPTAPPTGRLHHLDVIRGLAMLGILPVNLWFFAYPTSVGLRPDDTVVATIADSLALEAMRLGFQYKFITIFSFLFGVGLALLWQKARAAGRSYGSVMVPRLLLLGVLGVLHAVFLWYGEIVAVYAGIGLALCALAGLRPRTLTAIGTVFMCIPLGVLALLVLLAVSGNGPEATAGGIDPAAATGPLGEFIAAAFQSLDHKNPEFETLVFQQGSFGRISILRTVIWGTSLIFTYGLYYGWRLAGLMCLGMACLRAGWFADPRGHPGPFRKMITWGLVTGLPLHAVAFGLRQGSGELAGALSEVVLYFGSLGLAAAYVGIVALTVARFGLAWFLVPFAAVGRTAFSNYVLQSVIAVLLFYSQGFALFGTLDPTDLWTIACAMWAVELTLSTLWLIPFRVGPIEWFWRSLSLGRRLPLRA